MVKATSIVAVVLIHSITNRFQLESGFQRLLADWAIFAVPSFLFASGFLFNKGDSPTLPLARKLCGRIVPPYLVCSLAVMAIAAARAVATGNPLPLGLSDVVSRLAAGKAVGIYYFVFVLCYLYAFGLWLRKWPVWLIHTLFGVNALALVGYYLGYFDWCMPKDPDWWRFAMMRNPITRLLPFLAGWIVALNYGRIRPMLAKHAGWIITTALVIDVVLLAHLQSAWTNGQRDRAMGLLVQVHVYLFLACLLSLGVRFQPRARAILFLSTASYAIYLLHIHFVTPLHSAFGHTPLALYFRIPAIWLISLALTLLAVVLIKRILGSRSLSVIGA